MVAPCGGLEQSGRSMDDQISNYLQRRKVAFTLEYPFGKDQLWQLISEGGNLNQSHPYCLENEVISWDENFRWRQINLPKWNDVCKAIFELERRRGL